MKKYSSVETAVGTVYAAATERGICRIALNATETEFQRKAPGAVRDDAALTRPLGLLRRYLAGENVSLDSIEVDISAGTRLQQAVWRALRGIPKGTTVSYGQLAARVGRPRAARAVGNIVGQNPVAFILPCHRVVRSDGSLGGFGLGADIKEYLLETIEKASLLPHATARSRQGGS
jgi:AraC family transcriptional regulator of adaptative response/methylated-DNA-[protein]-cysteine methyltransferase